MTKKNRSGFSEKTKTNTTFSCPELHSNVCHAVKDDIPSAWYNRNGSNHTAEETYETNVMGRFTCDNASCANTGWVSKMVAIFIRWCPKNGYDATVFNQHCIKCKRLGSLTLDEITYVERVEYRLRKWTGVAVEQPVYNEKDGPPHETDLCEECWQVTGPEKD